MANIHGITLESASKMNEIMNRGITDPVKIKELFEKEEHYPIELELVKGWVEFQSDISKTVKTLQAK